MMLRKNETLLIPLVLLLLVPLADINVASAIPQMNGVVSPIGKTIVKTLPTPTASTNASALPLLEPNLQTSSVTDQAPTVRVVSLNSPVPKQGNPLPLAVGGYTGIVGLDEQTSGGYAPPDVQVASGIETIEMVNVAGEIWTQAGTPVETFSLTSFFLMGNDRASDPKVLYDSTDGRLYASMLDVTTGTIHLAVSYCADPMCSWTVYSISPSSTGALPDQPILGLSNDKVILSANDFVGSTSIGAEFWVLNKGDLEAGASVRYADFGPYASLFSVHPVQTINTTPFSTAYMVSDGDGGTSLLQVYAVTGVPPDPVSVTTYSLSVAPIEFPPVGEQPGTSSTVNTGDSRVLSAVFDTYFNDIWLSLNDACILPGDSQVRSCGRIIEVSTSSMTVTQDFDFGSPAAYFFYPAIWPQANNLAIVFGVSSSAVYPTMGVTGQAWGDPPDTLENAIYYSFSNPASDTTGRYGDYFGASVSYGNPVLVWLAGEYGTSVSSTYQWGTFLTSVRVVPSPTSTPLVTAVMGGTATDFKVVVSAPSTSPYGVGSITFQAPSGWTFGGTPNCGAILDEVISRSSTSVDCGGGLPTTLSDTLDLGTIKGPSSPASNPAPQGIFTTIISDDSGAPPFSGGTISIYSVAATNVDVSPSSATKYVAGSLPITITASLSSGQKGVPIVFAVSSTANGESLTPASALTGNTGMASTSFAPSQVVGTTDTVSASVGVGSGISGSSGSITTATGSTAKTSTVVSPNPSEVAVGSNIVFKAKVRDSSGKSPGAPTGAVAWSDGDVGGSFSSSSCILSSTGAQASVCTTVYTPPQIAAPITITAAYAGDQVHAESSGKSSLTVLRASSTSVSPAKTSETIGNLLPVTFVVAVTDTSIGETSAPTGNVKWNDGGKGGTFSSTSCTLSPTSTSSSTCTVTYTPSPTAPIGKIRVTASYSGDGSHMKSSGSGTVRIS